MRVMTALRQAGWVLIVLLLLGTAPGAQKKHAVVAADLEGTWIGATMTPLQRPPGFTDKATFTPEEAAEWTRGHVNRTRERLPTENDRLTQIDIDETYAEIDLIALDGLRTSLIVDPPNGMLPPTLPKATARGAAARARRTFEEPETFTLGERCLLGNFGLGGSTASPPLVPGPVLVPFYQIVQTTNQVLIFSEWMHDARVVRLNGTHAPSSVRSWLGDAIGHWDGGTLVVDTTNFRADIANLGTSDRLHVVERFTRRDAERLHYRITVEDSDTWESAWTAEWDFRASPQPLYEVACHEGNTAIEFFLRGARAEERQRSLPR